MPVRPDSSSSSKSVAYKIVNSLMLVVLLVLVGSFAVMIMSSEGNKLTALRAFFQNFCPWALAIGASVTKIKGITTQDPFLAFFYVLIPTGFLLLIVTAIVQYRFFSDEINRSQIEEVRSPNKRLAGAIAVPALVGLVFAHFIGRGAGFGFQALVFAAVCGGGFWYMRRIQNQTTAFMQQLQKDGLELLAASDSGDVVGEGKYRGVDVRVTLERDMNSRGQDDHPCKLVVSAWTDLPAPITNIAARGETSHVPMKDTPEFDMPELNGRGFLVGARDQAASEAFLRASMQSVNQVLNNASALMIDREDENGRESTSLVAVQIMSLFGSNGAASYRPLLDSMVDLVNTLRPS